jgi:hypothetical protein
MIFYDLYEINSQRKRYRKCYTICQIIEYNDDGYSHGDGHVYVEWEEGNRSPEIYSSLDEFKKLYLNENCKLYRFP